MNQRHNFTLRDFETLCWDLRKVSIFSSKPLRIKCGRFEHAGIGFGYGGISESMSVRGERCDLGCGQCCTNVKWPLLIWYESEKRPEGCDRLEVEINGVTIPVWVWMYETQAQCAFRSDASNLFKCLCHTTRPMMCHFGPQTGMYHHRNKLWLSRRMVGRNHRWPKCAVPASTLPFTEETRAENRYIFETLAKLGASFDPSVGALATEVAQLFELSRPGRIELPL